MKPLPVPSTPSKKRKMTPEPEFTSPPKSKGSEPPGWTPKTPSKFQQPSNQSSSNQSSSNQSSNVCQTPRKRPKNGEGTSRTPSQKERRRVTNKALYERKKAAGIANPPRSAEEKEKRRLRQKELRAEKRAAILGAISEETVDQGEVQNLDPDNKQGQPQPEEEPLPQRDLSSPDPNKKPHELPSLPAVRELGLQSEDPTSKGFPPPNVSNNILPPPGPHNPTEREFELERIILKQQLTIRSLEIQLQLYTMSDQKDNIDLMKMMLAGDDKATEAVKEGHKATQLGHQTQDNLNANRKENQDKCWTYINNKPPAVVPGGAATAATGTSSLSGGASFGSNGGFGAAAASLGGGGAAFVGTGNQGSPMMQSTVEWYSFREDNLFHPAFQCVMDNTLPENPHNNKYYIKIVDGQPGAGWEGAVGALYSTLNGADEARLKMFQK